MGVNTPPRSVGLNKGPAWFCQETCVCPEHANSEPFEGSQLCRLNDLL